MQVLHATRVMLNADLMEKKEITSHENDNTNLIPYINMHAKFAGVLDYVDTSFNPLVAKDEASFRVYLNNSH